MQMRSERALMHAANWQYWNCQILLRFPWCPSRRNDRENKHAICVRYHLGGCCFHLGHGRSQHANFGAVQERVQGRVRKDVVQRPVYEGVRRPEGQKVTGSPELLPGPSIRRPCLHGEHELGRRKDPLKAHDRIPETSRANTGPRIGVGEYGEGNTVYDRVGKTIATHFARTCSITTRTKSPFADLPPRTGPKASKERCQDKEWVPPSSTRVVASQVCQV